jgi:hypothetical protein
LVLHRRCCRRIFGKRAGIGYDAQIGGWPRESLQLPDPDYNEDDERSMNLQPPIFQAKFLGYKKVLIVAHLTSAYVDESARYGKPTSYYWPLLFPKPVVGAWELRTIAVLDVRRTPAHASGYCYGSRMAFIDKETWQPDWMDLYDPDLKLWKPGPSVYHPVPLPNTNGDVATGAGGDV